MCLIISHANFSLAPSFNCSIFNVVLRVSMAMGGFWGAAMGVDNYLPLGFDPLLTQKAPLYFFEISIFGDGP